jgi:hypothetical protein
MLRLGHSRFLKKEKAALGPFLMYPMQTLEQKQRRYIPVPSHGVRPAQVFRSEKPAHPRIVAPVLDLAQRL